MRWLLLAVAFGAAACSPIVRPPENSEPTQWHTLSGEPLSRGEFEALRESCLPRIRSAAVDPSRTVPSPAGVNPAYAPGGVGLMSAAPTGIARAGAPVDVDTTAITQKAAMPLDECLKEKGLIRVP